MKNRFFRTLSATTFLCAASIPAFGQADVSSATVKGKVTDPQVAVIPGATVTITSVDQGTSRTTVTDSTGEFQVRLVRPGLHDITVEASGFSQYLLKDIQLTVGQTATFDIKLQVAGVRTEMVVTTSAPLIEIERTQQANTIEPRQVENLSNVGRTFTDLCLHAAWRVELERPAGPARGTHYGFQLLQASRLAAATGATI